MNFEGLKISKKNEVQKPEILENVFLPHVEAIVKAYEKHFSYDLEKDEVAAIKEIIYAYFEQRIENTKVYNSEKMGASFVYNVTDTADLAKRLYLKNTGNKNLELKKDSGEIRNSEKDFMFIGGLVSAKNGNEYSSQEVVIHRMIEELPHAFKDINEGREPKNKEIYTLASPTNELGEISEKFADNLTDTNATEQFGLLYAELVEDLLSKDGQNAGQTKLYFNGVSMGSGFAIETARKLVADGVVTQKNDEKEKPFLQIEIDTPPGQSEISPKIKKWQIPIGFGIQIINSLTTDKYIRKVMFGDTRFVNSKNVLLAEMGIDAEMSQEQNILKKKAISKVMKSLVSGVPVPKDLKVTEVIGVFDPLMYSSLFNKKVKEQKGKFDPVKKDLDGAPLGENIISDSNNTNRRTFGIQTSHSIPFLRNSEFQRIHKAARALADLKLSQRNNFIK